MQKSDMLSSKSIIVDNEKKQIDMALAKLEKVIIETGNNNDINYFKYHKMRFRKMGESVLTICKKGGVVLDIGSHYLHSSLLLHFLGYKVVSMDVENFWDIEYVRERADRYNLVPVVENDLQTLQSLKNEHDNYDLILFTEIFEHITFNPIIFWKRIYTLIKDRGVIYISTPNSLRAFNVVKTLYNIFMLNGVGISVNAVFANVTYGHHWKEYSSKELKYYFKKMNDGFNVSVKKNHYRTLSHDDSSHNRVIIILLYMINQIPFFRDALEATVTVDKTFPWKVNSPLY